MRTAIGAAFLTWVVIIFAVGSTDRLFFRLHIDYVGQIHFWRIGVWVLPIIVFFLTRSVCGSLQRSEIHPLRAWQGEVVMHDSGGAPRVLAESPDRLEDPVSESPVGTVPGEE